MITNHYGITVNSMVPVTGVFQNNYVDCLMEEIQGDSIDLDYEGAFDYFIAEETSKIQKILDEIDGENLEASCENIKDICEMLENPDGQIGYGDSLEWLIGFKKTRIKNKAWYWFDDLKYGYEPDETAEYSAIVGEIYTQVVKSKWLIKCALCSPSYPGQGDADSEGEFLAYSLPPELFEDHATTERIYRKN